MLYKLSISLSLYQLKGREMNVLADTAVVYMLDSTSMIAYNSSYSSEEHGYIFVFQAWKISGITTTDY